MAEATVKDLLAHHSTLLYIERDWIGPNISLYWMAAPQKVFLCLEKTGKNNLHPPLWNYGVKYTLSCSNKQACRFLGPINVQKLLEIQGTVSCLGFGTQVISLSLTEKGIWLKWWVRQQPRWEPSEIMCIWRKLNNSVFKRITWKQQHNYAQILQSLPKAGNFLQ